MISVQPVAPKGQLRAHFERKSHPNLTFHQDSPERLQKMRVGLIIYNASNRTTGGYIYDDKLVEYLRSQGVIIKIFLQKQAFSNVIFNNFSKQLIREIAAFSPDVLLQDELNFLSLFILNKTIKKQLNIPIISIVHLIQSNISKNFLMKWITGRLEYFYLKSVDGYIFNSHATLQAFINIYKEKNGSDIDSSSIVIPAKAGIHPENTTVPNKSMDPRLRGDDNCIKKRNYLVACPGKDRLALAVEDNHILSKKNTNKCKIIFIGNVSYNKGLHVLLKALSQIDSQSWELSIAGSMDVDKKYTQKILKMMQQYQLTDQIKMFGVLDINPLRQTLLSQNLLIVPSYYESYGMVYTEAMGAGLPVIASKSGGAAEIVSDQVNGFLIQPGDSAALRDYVIKLIDNRDLLMQMSIAARASYEKLPSWEESMGKIYGFLQENIQSTEPSRRCFAPLQADRY